jgi:hypothetical protein
MEAPKDKIKEEYSKNKSAEKTLNKIINILTNEK